MKLTSFLTRLDDFWGPQVPVIIGILNLVLSNRLRPTQVAAPLPNAGRNPRFCWMVTGRTSLRVFSLSLDQTRPQPEAPLTLSWESVFYSWAFLGPFCVFYTRNPSLELEAAGAWCSPVAMISNHTFFHFLSYTSYFSTNTICHSRTFSDFSCSWILIYTDCEPGMASCCLLKRPLFSRCNSKTPSLPRFAPSLELIIVCLYNFPWVLFLQWFSANYWLICFALHTGLWNAFLIFSLYWLLEMG